jgi:SAM-dependent methyltransferase
MAQETSKASERRLADTARDWYAIVHGSVLDVGPGDDPLTWPDASIHPFDKKQGDANKIDTYFHDQSFDCIHGSQVMEHLYNPSDFINRCLKILKPGGWIVMTVPDYDLYEKRRFPSQYNPDHKTTWSLWRTMGGIQSHNRAPHIHVPTWIKQFDVAQRYATLIDTNYDYLAPDTKDQTWLREDGVECFIEILLQKKP